MADYGNCSDPTGTVCASGPQPGTLALRNAVIDLYLGIGDLGIYNCRPSSGGGGLSTHGEGRGWDARCNANSPSGLALGNRLGRDLWTHRQSLGVQRIIWNHRQIDIRQPIWRTYGCDSPGSSKSHHVDHLHIELCWAAAKHQPLTSAYVKQVLSGQTGDDEVDPETKQYIKETRDFMERIVAALTDGNAGTTLAQQGGTNQRLDRILEELQRLNTTP